MFSDKLTVHYPLLDTGQTVLWIDQLVNKGEHLAAIKHRYFPLEMVETKTEHKREWILNFTINIMHVKIHSFTQDVSWMLSSPSNMPVWQIEPYGRPTLASRPQFGQFRGLANSMLHCLGYWCEITNEIPSTKVYKACVQASQCRWMHSKSATISYWENGKFSSNLGEFTL